MAGQSERARFEVLLEEVRSDVRMVIEGLHALDQKIDREVARLEQSLGSRITTLELAVTAGFRDLRQELRTHVHS